MLTSDDFDPSFMKKRCLRRRRILPAPRLFSLALEILIFLLIPSSALAQTTGSATLRGTVRDANGSVITQSMVTLINEGTNDERRTTTNSEGSFTFSAINPGSYTVKVEISGFKTYKQIGIVISPSDTHGLDIQLEVGAANESLTITASAEPIQKETGAKEHTIRANQIDNLSIISRSSLELLRILPGVAVPNQSQLESVAFFSGANANAD